MKCDGKVGPIQAPKLVKDHPCFTWSDIAAAAAAAAVDDDSVMVPPAPPAELHAAAAAAAAAAIPERLAALKLPRCPPDMLWLL